MRRHLACLATFGLALAFSGTSRANLITNGSFENATLTTAQTTALNGPQGFVTLTSPSTAIDGWVVTGQSIDYIGSRWQASDGNRSIDLDGNGQGGLTASTSFSVVSGTTYQVQFDMAGNPDGPPPTKTLSVSAGDNANTFSQNYTFDTTGRTHSNMGWTTNFFTFTAATTGTYGLSFSSDTAGPYGAALDNVIVSAVPEPASLAMCGTTLLIGAGIAFRRRKARIAQV